MNYQFFVEYIQDTFQTREFIPLHAPCFSGNERKYVSETLDSTVVSTVGRYVDQFEEQLKDYTGSISAVATVNGTAALHTGLYMSGVMSGDLVITQALTFVATCNVLYHMGVEPVFVDVSDISLGMCPFSLESFLSDEAILDDEGICIHRSSGKRISAILPMHTFGHPVEIEELLAVCQRWNLVMIEDAAESLGSFYKGKHTGIFGRFSAISFNGNKIITTGGGGMVLCQNYQDGQHVKHVTSTAKIPHSYEYFHDEPGFNHRMPNLNAALGCGQMESLEFYLNKKRQLANDYQDFFKKTDFRFVTEPDYAKSNYWLNAIRCPSKESRDELLKYSNEHKIMTRPVWTLMHRLPMFKQALRSDLSVSEKLESCLVNIPSSVNIPVEITYA